MQPRARLASPAAPPSADQLSFAYHATTGQGYMVPGGMMCAVSIFASAHFRADSPTRMIR